jgi:hypothetical protein
MRDANPTRANFQEKLGKKRGKNGEHGTRNSYCTALLAEESAHEELLLELFRAVCLPER